MRTMNLLKLLVTVVLGTTLMSAQASRTWVSGVGDDANPCSRTAPCKTFAGAISKTAPGGEIDALDPGGFGAVTITKAITLDGGGGQVASVLVNGTNGIVVQAGASDVVTIRNLRINGIRSGANGGLNGIRWTSGAALHIENCYIFGFTGNAIDIAKADGGQAFIIDTFATNNGGSGVKAQDTVNTVHVTVSRSRFEQNQFGIFSSDFSRFSVDDSDASGNSNTGIIVQSSAGTSEADVASTMASNNGNAGLLSGGGSTSSIIRLSGVTIYGNTNFGIFISGSGQVISYTNTPNFNSDPVSGTVTTTAPF